MARNIPKALATFVSSDPEIARMYSNVQAAVQPLLDFYNRWFSTATAGRLTILGSVASQVGSQITVLGAGGATGNFLTSFRQIPDGTQAAPGLAFASNGASGIWHTGGSTASEMWNIVMQGVKQLSVTPVATIFQAPPNGAVAIFNDSTGKSLGTINGQGVVNMPSFVSPLGFKNTYYLGQVTTSSQAANSTVQTYEVTNTVAGNSAGARYSSYTMPFPGSIMALTVDSSAINVAMSIQLYKNGAIIANASTVLSTNTTKVVANFNKGTFSFVAGDNLYCIITYQAAVSSLVSTFPRVTVEFGS
jgi:hypothetical protein